MNKLRLTSRVACSGLLITAASVVVLVVAVATFFSARSLYAAMTTRLARVLLRLWRVRVHVHQPTPFPQTQVVYVSNHSSTLDLFILVALGLPRTRFFLSGFLQKYVPLAILARLMGTFFTVPQTHQTQRRRIFAAACDTLRRTGESVYLSPEGARITSGAIGSFNKGAFHLAAALRAPIVPLYFAIPSDIDPGMGFDAQPGVVDVYVKPTIDTRDWRIDDISVHKDTVRNMFVGWHAENEELRTKNEESRAKNEKTRRHRETIHRGTGVPASRAS